MSDNNAPTIADVMEDESPGSVMPQTEVKFKNGKPVQVSCWIGVKMTTRQYENITYGYGMAMSLNEDADVAEAMEEVTSFVESTLRPKIVETRKKYPG